MKLRNILVAKKNGLIVDAILWRLKKLGIIFNPYYIIQENADYGRRSTWGEKYNAYWSGFLGQDDMDEVVLLGGHDLEQLFRRLEHGDLCFGLRKEDNLIAYTWCDLKVFNSPYHQSDLSENEVYLYDALVAPVCRGQGIAPFMRFKFYESLEKLSKNIFLSYSDYANTPAVRFKKKLGARFLKLCLYINLWNKYSGHWVLRDYTPKLAVASKQR